MSAVEPPFLGDLRREFQRVAEADAAAGRPAPRRRPQLRPLRLRVAVPVATAVAMLAALIVLATGIVSLSVDVGGGEPVPMVDPIEGGFDASLVAGVSVLGRERSASDAIDAGISEELPENLALGRSLRVLPPPGADVGDSANVGWLVPADGQLAIVGWSRASDRAQAWTIVDLAGVERGRAIGTIGDSIFGVVPNGVDEVVVKSGEGGTQTVPVRDNVFVGRVEGGFQGLSWEGMRGP